MCRRFRAAGAEELCARGARWCASGWPSVSPCSALQPPFSSPRRRHIELARVAENRSQELQRLRSAVRTTATVS